MSRMHMAMGLCVRGAGPGPVPGGGSVGGVMRRGSGGGRSC